MSKFNQILLGTKARRALQLPLGRNIDVDVRVITAQEELEALAMARKGSQERGVSEPKEGDAIYDLMLMAAVLKIASIDHESTEDRPEPFFDSMEQVLSLGRDYIVYLYEAQDALQESLSPRKKKLSPEEYIAMIVQLSATEEEAEGLDPFVRWPRATLVSCMRTMAQQLVSYPVAKLQPISSHKEPTGNGL